MIIFNEKVPIEDRKFYLKHTISSGPHLTGVTITYSKKKKRYHVEVNKGGHNNIVGHVWFTFEEAENDTTVASTTGHFESHYRRRYLGYKSDGTRIALGRAT